MIVYRATSVAEGMGPQGQEALPLPVVAMIIGEQPEAKHARFLGIVRGLHQIWKNETPTPAA